jgi:hypothetical protein
MSRQPRKTRKRPEPVRFWTYDQAQAAVPYIASILRSIREHNLDLAAAERRIRVLDGRPGRPDRTTLIALHDAKQEADRISTQLEHALDELDDLDATCIDPLHGLALLPFLHDDQLAWYVFDLFDREPLRFWRYQTDPLETRRPIREVVKVHSSTTY